LKKRRNFRNKNILEEKKNKHEIYFKIERVTANLMAIYYGKKDMAKILGLRVDTLSYMLSIGNVLSNSSVIVAENCSGLVVGSILERTQGTTQIVSVNSNAWSFNNWSIPKSYLNAVHTLDYCDLPHFHFPEYLGVAHRAKGVEILRNKADGLFIASKFEPYSVFRELFPYLEIGRPFVVYSTSLTALTTLYEKILSEKSSANLDITEFWMREYQIFPRRFHPQMRMNSASGYVLSGIKVESRDRQPKTGKTEKKQEEKNFVKKEETRRD